MQRPLYIADHQERLLCPIPLKIDCYQGCGGQCVYCSINGLRGRGGGNGYTATVTPNSVHFIERAFYKTSNSMEAKLIDQRSPIQIGVLSDPLQPLERQHHTTLRVLKILKDHSYPTILVSKFVDRLTKPEYLAAIDGLPLVVQCSISSGDPAMIKRLEPGAPSLKDRMEALQKLHEAGVIVQLRLWPYIPQIEGDLELLPMKALDVGCSDVLANCLKVYHAGGCGQRLQEALGRDVTHGMVNYGVYKAPSYVDQLRDFQYLQNLCRTLGLNLYSCNFPEARGWQSCCGVEKYKGFEGIARWGYYVNGYRIQQHTSFEEYIKDINGMDCPFEADLKSMWDHGKLANIHGILFNSYDLTYSITSKLN